MELACPLFIERLVTSCEQIVDAEQAQRDRQRRRPHQPPPPAALLRVGESPHDVRHCAQEMSMFLGDPHADDRVVGHLRDRPAPVTHGGHRLGLEDGLDHGPGEQPERALPREDAVRSDEAVDMA